MGSALQGSSTLGLADRMREATRDLHAQAEASGVVAALLGGQGSVRGYALLLANLRPAYVALEAALERAREHPAVAPLAAPSVYRAAAIDTALAALGLSTGAPLAPAQRYAERITASGRAAPARLVAHAYVRYLGDLAGGALLARRVRTSLGLGGDALAFHAFPALPDPRAFAGAYRAAIDAAGRTLGAAADAAVEEACVAFEHNIAIATAIAQTDPV